MRENIDEENPPPWFDMQDKIFPRIRQGYLYEKTLKKLGMTQHHMSLLASVASRFMTADLTYFLSDIDQHLFPPFVSTFSSKAPRFMTGGSALSHFSLNTHLIPSDIFMGTQLITSTSSA